MVTLAWNKQALNPPSSSNDCPPAVTHTNNAEKSGVELYLNGPPGAIVFTAIAVRDFNTFWVDRYIYRNSSRIKNYCTRNFQKCQSLIDF